MRSIPSDPSTRLRTALGRGAQKLGQPVPLSNLVFEENAGSAHPAQAAERFEVTLTDAQWRKKLSPDAYNTLRKEGTERPYSSPLNGEHRAGIFS